MSCRGYAEVESSVISFKKGIETCVKFFTDMCELSTPRVGENPIYVRPLGLVISFLEKAEGETCVTTLTRASKRVSNLLPTYSRV